MISLGLDVIKVLISSLSAKNCHNKIAWDPNYGKPFTDETIEQIINKFAENAEYNDGLSLLGGEPLETYNQEGLLKLTTRFKQEFPNKNIWCWTGYDFDKDILSKMYLENDVTKKLLSNIDIIVDGTYEEDKKMIDLDGTEIDKLADFFDVDGGRE